MDDRAFMLWNNYKGHLWMECQQVTIQLRMGQHLPAAWQGPWKHAARAPLPKCCAAAAQRFLGPLPATAQPDDIVADFCFKTSK